MAWLHGGGEVGKKDRIFQYFALNYTKDLEMNWHPVGTSHFHTVNEFNPFQLENSVDPDP